MTPIQLIKNDHRVALDLVAQLVETTERSAKKRESLFEKLKAELKAHEYMEEQVIYPFLYEYPETQELIDKSYAAHHVVDFLVEELTNLDVQDSCWKAELLVLQDNLKQHIKEEEKLILPQLKALLDKDALKTMATDLTIAKKEAKHSLLNS